MSIRPALYKADPKQKAAERQQQFYTACDGLVRALGRLETFINQYAPHELSAYDRFGARAHFDEVARDKNISLGKSQSGLHLAYTRIAEFMELAYFVKPTLDGTPLTDAELTAFDPLKKLIDTQRINTFHTPEAIQYLHELCDAIIPEAINVRNSSTKFGEALQRALARSGYSQVAQSELRSIHSDLIAAANLLAASRGHPSFIRTEPQQGRC